MYKENGVPLAANAVTLTTVLKKRDYRTAAFVGGFVLDRRFGLNRGFDVYDSPFDLHKQTVTDVGDLKRQGSQVAGAAMRWLERNSSTPFFLFLHLYDLHTPYALPQSGRLHSGEAGYDAELAYVDRVLGEFFRFLDAHELLKRSLIVFTSDHGEGLGDHDESTHGYFVYQSTIHVPLIIHWPETMKRMAKSRVDEPASLLDVAPTVLDALGLAAAARRCRAETSSHQKALSRSILKAFTRENTLGVPLCELFAWEGTSTLTLQSQSCTISVVTQASCTASTISSDRGQQPCANRSQRSAQVLLIVDPRIPKHPTRLRWLRSARSDI